VSNPTFRLDDKVAVITGGSRGLGRAMALGFAEAGPCEDVATEVRSLGRRALPVACHVGDWQACEALVARAVEEFGRVDILVNNAGIAPVPPSLLGMTEDLFDKTLAVNLKGPMRLTGLAAEYMRPGSTIINISSKASTHTTPHTVVYGAAKAGLNALTRASSQELAPKGVRVNGIVCGPFHSDSFDRSAPTPEIEQIIASSVTLKRIAEADEIVGTALYLASDASSYMTGELLALDGGGV
jgi:NAD(P)-dependent dehydrogenase (short-subunit alcohol dehydrogenase family)